MPPATTKDWDDMAEKNLLLEALQIDGHNISRATFAKIAEKWGPPHTVEGLRQRFARMKKDFAKVEGIPTIKQTGGKRSASETGEGEAAGSSKKSSKTKRTKQTAKNSAVKAEPAGDDV